MIAKNKAFHQADEYDAIVNTPVGNLGMLIVDGRLVKIDFLSSDLSIVSPKDRMSSKVVSSLKKYFSDSKEGFDFPFSLLGTSLQIKIWKSLQKIPVGKTITYGRLAEKLKTSPRVIGNACRSNPLPIIIPCHRVVSVQGMGGFCGETNGDKIKIKEWLLAHEGV